MTRIHATLLLLILLTAVGLAPADAAQARVPAPAPTQALATHSEPRRLPGNRHPHAAGLDPPADHGRDERCR